MTAGRIVFDEKARPSDDPSGSLGEMTRHTMSYSNVFFGVMLLLPMTQLLLLSSSQDASLTWSGIASLADYGLLPWEWRLFDGSPTPYQNQFIALALPLSLPLFSAMIYYYLFRRGAIIDHVTKMETDFLFEQQRRKEKLAMTPQGRQVRMLVSVIFWTIFMFLMRLPTIYNMSRLAEYKRPMSSASASPEYLRTIMPLFISFSTLTCGFLLIIVIGHTSIMLRMRREDRVE